jgi:DNA repair photolyase
MSTAGIQEIQTKQILTPVKNPTAWFGVNYNMNIYRGCQHQCIYCDSRSECYQIVCFDDLLVKINAVERLKQELAKKRRPGIIGTGGMSDPYTKAETRYRLTGNALQAIADYGFGIHITTKSDLIGHDIAALKKISKVWAAVAFTITTADDDLARQIEPLAPLPSRRLAAMQILSAAGIFTGVAMMPLLPFIEDNPENISQIVEKAAQCGAQFILPWFGMSLRDRQRDYYYAHISRLFPGLPAKYEQLYGNQYICNSPRQYELERLFRNLCASRGIIADMQEYLRKLPNLDSQLNLF